MKTYFRLAAIALVATVVACASDETKDDAGASGSSTSPYDSGTSSGTGGDSVVGAPSASGGGGAVPSGNVVYFEFDSSDLKPEGAAVAEAWAQYLAANPGAKVRLEGHADERGTREYNVGLGERRANAVLQAMTSRGASERQLAVSSFGEERPVAMGHDEAAWTQNRRVEIVQ